jgi:hypothetical protein
MIDRERSPFRRFGSPLALAALAGAIVTLVGALLFPHLSPNHDEAVYLQQAALLLDGQFQYHAGPLADAVRPWFFVRDGGRLYPKYAPVPGGLFAIGTALGVPRLSLGLVAAGNAALVYGLAGAAFDRRTAILAVAFLLASPLFLLTSATFLPYAPTTLLNLGFAFAYVRAARRSSRGWAALAGLAIGLAFFARPFTAVLFATPFVVHAGWTVLAARTDRKALPSVAVRQGITALVGLAGVILALLYNWSVTGDPLLFPYEAFAPLDGLGFGRRRILGHELLYTPALAVRRTVRLLRILLTRWTAAGTLGSLAPLVGIAATVRGLRKVDWRPSPNGLEHRTLRILLLGLLASVTLGNVYFWGTANVLGDPADPTDGLIAFLGPFYHFDLLLPLSAFGAAGTLVVGRKVRDRITAVETLSPQQTRAVLLALLLLVAPVALAAEASVLGPPVERNLAHTEAYDRAYQPFEDRRLENAVVFAPTTYGDWLAHPFQRFRNDPGLDGPVVYALDRGGGNLDVVGAYPNRTYYRYTYRGEWLGEPETRITPALQPLDVRRSSRLEATTTVGVPADAIAVVVRVSYGGTTARYRIDDVATDGSSLALRWTLTPDGVRLGNASSGVERASGPERVPIDGDGTLAVSITIHADRGPTLTYRQEASVRTTDDRVAVLWPPHRTVCTLVRDCGREGTYLPGRPEFYPDGVRFRTNVSAVATEGYADRRSPEDAFLDGNREDRRPDGHAAGERIEGRLPRALAVVDREFRHAISAQEWAQEEFRREPRVFGPLDVLDHLATVGPHPGRRVPDALADEEARHEGERAVAQAVEPGHRLGPAGQAVAAHHVVAGIDRVEEPGERRHRVGVVAVRGDDHRAVGRLQGPTDGDAVALRFLTDHPGAELASDFGGPVGRAIDADHRGPPARDALDVVEHPGDRSFLVVGPHDDAHVVEGVPLRFPDVPVPFAPDAHCSDVSTGVTLGLPKLSAVW